MILPIPEKRLPQVAKGLQERDEATISEVAELIQQYLIETEETDAACTMRDKGMLLRLCDTLPEGYNRFRVLYVLQQLDQEETEETP